MARRAVSGEYIRYDSDTFTFMPYDCMLFAEVVWCLSVLYDHFHKSFLLSALPALTKVAREHAGVSDLYVKERITRRTVSRPPQDTSDVRSLLVGNIQVRVDCNQRCHLHDARQSSSHSCTIRGTVGLTKSTTDDKVSNGDQVHPLRAQTGRVARNDRSEDHRHSFPQVLLARLAPSELGDKVWAVFARFLQLIKDNTGVDIVVYTKTDEGATEGGKEGLEEDEWDGVVRVVCGHVGCGVTVRSVRRA